MRSYGVIIPLNDMVKFGRNAPLSTLQTPLFKNTPERKCIGG